MKLARYDRYSRANEEWLPTLPAHWQRQRLKFLVAASYTGGTPATANDSFWNGDIPWVSPKDMKVAEIFTTEDYISEEGLAASASKMVPPGALLVVMRSGILRHSIPAALTGRDVAINQDIKALVFGVAGDAAYYRYFIEGLQTSLLNRWSKIGCTVESIESDLMMDEVVPVPTPAEQSAIVRFLDAETAEIDALIAKKRRLLDLLAEQRAALITRAVTKGLDPTAPMKPSGLPWLGDIPAHWEIVQLRHIIRSDTTITYGIIQAGPDTEGGIPYIRTSDMAGDELPLDGYLRTTPEIDASYHRSKVSAGDVVVAIRATIGKPLMVPSALEGANLTQGTARIAPGSRVTAEYLCLFLRSAGATQEFDRLAKGATFKEITLEMLRKFPLALPPIAEQRAIVEAVSASRGSNARATILRQIATLHEYRTALISAAVTGQIDVRNWSAKRAAA